MSDNSVYCIKNGRPDESRSDIENAVYDFIDKLNIDFLRIDHEPASSIDSLRDIKSSLNTDVHKNLLLKNSAKTQYYLLIMDGDKKFNSSSVSHQINSSRLSFTTAEDMYDLLGITPGSLSILGLINDRNNRVKLLVDADILQKTNFGCHPCVNTSTLKFSTSDIFYKFLPATAHDFMTVVI